MPDFAVIIAAGGRSTRFVGADKLLTPLNGVPILRRSVDPFLKRSDVVSLILASNRPDLLRPILPNDPRIGFASAGHCRAASVWSAVQAIDPAIEWVAIHDGARPLISAGLIDRIFAAAMVHGSVGPAVPVSLTIKQATPPLPSRIVRTVPRKNLFAMQTPQVARREALLQAFDRFDALLDSITDDLQLMEMAGAATFLIDGERGKYQDYRPC